MYATYLHTLLFIIIKIRIESLLYISIGCIPIVVYRVYCSVIFVFAGGSMEGHHHHHQHHRHQHSGGRHHGFG